MKRIIVLCWVNLLVALSTISPARAASETFDAYANGTAITNIPGWTAGGPAIVAGGGVNGTAGLGTSSLIFNWGANALQWGALSTGSKIRLAMDFQSNGSGQFDDDRVSLITSATSTSSDEQFGLQLDNGSPAGMTTYWRNSNNARVSLQLNALSGVKANTWYRFQVEYTKLSAGSARLDGTLTELDGAGNPTGTPYTGTVADTSALGTNTPATRYLSAANLYPSFKNYDSTTGNADNASYILIPAGPQPPTVNITSPANNATVGTNFTITATATDDGTVTNVAFYAGGTLLGNDPTSPYSFTWTAAPLGSTALTAVAWDNEGLSATSAVVNVTVAAGGTVTNFTAYNDCSKGAGTNPANTTEYRGDGVKSGFLKDFNTGATLPVTLTIDTNLVSFNGTGGPMPNAGTDAYNTFNGKVIFDNVVWYTTASNGFWMDAIFTGLDPAKEYEFATSVNRGGSGSDYGNRFSKFTISDVDSAENASTPGVTVNSPTSVTFCSGSNTVNGYVARWVKIKCGADGDFKVRVEDGGGVGKGYAFDGIMLRETSLVGPQPPTVAITSPANNATVGPNFTITATATDDGTVTNVAFYAGGALLGKDTTSPYSFTWNGAAPGNHALTAVARDNDGLTTTSAVVNVTVMSVVTTTENFNSYPNGTLLTNIGGGGVWTVGTNLVLNTGGVNGSGGLSPGNWIFNWKAQSFQWSTLAIGTKVVISLDFQSSPTGTFDDDRVGWTITPDASTSTGSQLALQLDNTTEGGMVFYHNLTRTPVLNALAGIKNSTWYRFNVEFTKLTATSAAIVGTLTELDAAGNPTGTSYVGTIPDTSAFANPPSATLFTAAQQCPSFKNYSNAGGNADNATFTIIPPGPQPPTVSITSPANNATVGTTFTITATATDDLAVTNVAFYAGGTLLGNDTTSPYSFTWNGAPLGSHALRAVARDNEGLVATSAVVNVTVSLIGFTAYNDCSGGDPGNPPNTTQIGLSQTAPHAGQSGALKDFDTGATLPVTLTMVNNGAIATSGTLTGPMPAAGTDAYNTFNGKVVIASPGIRYGDTEGWWVEARFTGLDPDKEYEFVTTANRGTNTYTDRWSKYTLLGADSAVNASSAGVTVNSPTSVSFCTGFNDVNGYVARWTSIKCGSDGAFTVRVENDSSSGHDANRSYAFDAIMLRETVPASPQTVEHVIVISVDGIGSAYIPPLLTPGLANELTTFKRLQAEGSGTLNARTDPDYAVTMQNHVTMMTGRGVNGAAGHGWTLNGYPDGAATTLEMKKGSYVASAFDVAHDHGRRTGIWASKAKFALFPASYSAVSGAPDTTGPDNGRDKIDYELVVDGMNAAALTDDFLSQMAVNPCHFAFVHYQDPDATGHSYGWSTDPASTYASVLKAVDTQVGRIIQMVETNPVFQGKTAIILTSDHGGHGTTHGDMSNPLDYTIPFYVWGPGVNAGGDLYGMNPASRTEPGSANLPYTGGQPVRNGDAANLALDLLDLGPVPGSTINSAQDLQVTGDTTPPTIVSVTAVNATTVQVLFSEPVATASAQTVGNYSINNGISISAAVLQPDTRTVLLTTSPLALGSYILTVNNVTDRASLPNAILPNSQAPFSYSVAPVSPIFRAAASAVDTDGNTSANLVFAQPALTNGYVIVGISMWDPSVAASITSVTYGGAPMTLLGTIQDANAWAEIYMFGLPVGNLAAGNYTVALTGSTGIDQLAFGVSAFSGVRQTNSTGPFASAVGSTTTASVAVSSSANDVVVDIIGQDSGTSTAGAGQVENWRQEDATDRTDGVSTRKTATGSTTTMSYTESVASSWAMGAVALKGLGLPPVAPTLAAGPARLPNGHFYVGYVGTPNTPYTIQAATNILGPWQTLTNITANDSGLIELEDATIPAPPVRFYRAVYP